MGDYCVYKHTSPSGKVYIGTTKQNPEDRWANGLGYRGNEYFFSAICKYGWDSFQHEILISGLSYEDAASYEVDLIAIHNATNRTCGYNHRYGGSMAAHNEESKRKMSIAHTGMKVSPETRASMSRSHKARSIPESQRQRVKNGLRNKAVEQIDLNGNVIARFNKLVDAANSINSSRLSIRKVCKGINHTFKGYGWRYCDEDCR